MSSEKPKKTASCLLRQLFVHSTRKAQSWVNEVSENIIVGDDVRVKSNQKKGIVAFVGETKFAKGRHLGIVFEDAIGQNDGTIDGVQYFKCAALHAAFIRKDEVEKINKKTQSSIPSYSRNSSDSGICDEDGELNIGDRVQIEGFLRFSGTTEFGATWYGVEINGSSSRYSTSFDSSDGSTAIKSRVGTSRCTGATKFGCTWYEVEGAGDESFLTFDLSDDSSVIKSKPACQDAVSTQLRFSIGLHKVYTY